MNNTKGPGPPATAVIRGTIDVVLESVLGGLLLICVYVLIYFRLMVRFHHARVNVKKERSLLAVLTVPPYRNLDDKGKAYARRWWYTLLFMTVIVGVLATRIDFKHGPRTASTAAPPITKLEAPSVATAAIAGRTK